ncbi:hypothetical protein LCGC14_0979170, partial [marine sediment metagenome]
FEDWKNITIFYYIIETFFNNYIKYKIKFLFDILKFIKDI